MDILLDLDILDKEGVYRPDDDSYLLIELIRVEKGDRVLEIGPGSGIISIHCAIAGGHVTCVDINEDAIAITKHNAERNDVSLENILVGDMFQPVKGVWDVIVFNPPYLPMETAQRDHRWDGGMRGDETILRFLKEVCEHLDPEGRLYFCCSDLSPMEEIEGLIYHNFEVKKKKEKKYDFETLYGFELMHRKENN